MLNVNEKEVFIFRNIDELAKFAVEKFIAFSKEAITAKGYFTVALSGGRTPVVLYQRLSAQKTLPWDKIHIFMVDERFVPYGHEDNNYSMMSRTLLLHVPIPAKNIHPILTQEKSPQASAERFESDVTAFFKIKDKKSPRMDLVLLGIGKDGHTASLFPDSSALKETRRLAVPATPDNGNKKDRITLTFPVINNADTVIFLVSGIEKAKVVKEVIESENCQLPAAMVRPENGTLIFLLDESAAELLNKKSLSTD